MARSHWQHALTSEVKTFDPWEPDLPDLALPHDHTAVAASFQCSLSHSGRDAAWVHVCGELDLAPAPRLALTLHDALGSARLIIVDLRQLTFMDSPGVHKIIEAAAQVRRSSRRLAFIRGPAQIRSIGSSS